MRKPISILLLEDDPADAEFLLEFLNAEGLKFNVKRVETESDFRIALEDRNHDLIVSDFSLPAFDGMAALTIAKEVSPAMPFIFYSGTIGEEVAVEALRMGATDYVLKQRPQRLPAAIRRAIEEALLRQERMEAQQKILAQAKLLDLASDAIVVISLADEIIFWNQSAQKVFGYSATEVEQKLLPEILRAKFPPYRKTFEQCLLTGNWQGDLEYLNREKQVVIVHSRWTSVPSKGNQPHQILTINTDVTERRTFEAHLLRVQRLETIGTLASGVVHDLNNILAPIIMATEVLAMKSLGAQETRMIEMIRNSAQRGADVVKQVLTFVRGSEGKQMPLNLTRLFKDICHVISETFPRSIKIECSIEEELNILGDSTQIHQVVMNLCVNARDAMPGGGVLFVRAFNAAPELIAHISGHMPGRDYILVEVEDTGTGISPENLEKIFDPFFTTKAAGKGTGLGLSTAMGIVKTHAGILKVQSELGRGTTFQIFLPSVLSAAAGISETAWGNYKGDGELILVVDDEQSIRDITQQLLTEHGYSVITSADAYNGIIQAAAHKSALKVLLTDISMPEIDGLSFAKSVKSLIPGIKILTTSGSGKEEHDCPGDIEFLPKPCSSEDLLKAVKKAVSLAE